MNFSQKSQLYENVLCIILHTFDAQDQKSAFNFIKNAFGASTNKHWDIFKNARERNSTDFDFLTDPKKLKAAKSIENGSYGPNSPKIDFEPHQALITTLSLYEIEKAPENSWSGNYGDFPSKILKSHAKFCHLDDIQATIAKWAALVAIYQTHTFNFQVFADLLDELIEFDVTMKKKNQKVTWKLLPSMKPVKSFVPGLFVAKSKIKTQNPTSEEKVWKLKTEDSEMTEKFWIATKKLQDPIWKFVEMLNDDEDTFEKKARLLTKIFLVIEKIGKLENQKFAFEFQNLVAAAFSDCANRFMVKVISQLDFTDGSDAKHLTDLIRMLVATIQNYDTFSKHFSAIFNA